MAFTRDHSPLAVEALDMAHAIARRIGAKDYLTEKAKVVSGHLLSRETVPDQILIREGGELRPYRVIRVYPRPAVRRTVDKTKLQRVYPSAYAAAVTTSQPDKPYQVRLEPEFSGKRSREWETEKAAGAQRWAGFLEQRYGTLEWNRVDIQSRVLFELRRDIHDQTSRIEAARADLIAFITEHELPLVMRARGDGRLVLRENALRTSVDYDLLEQRFPAAASLIKRTTTPGTPQIRFLPPKAENADDDSDDSKSGIWTA